VTSKTKYKSNIWKDRLRETKKDLRKVERKFKRQKISFKKKSTELYHSEKRAKRLEDELALYKKTNIDLRQAKGA